jgi:hypothetical protein
MKRNEVKESTLLSEEQKSEIIKAIKNKKKNKPIPNICMLRRKRNSQNLVQFYHVFTHPAIKPSIMNLEEGDIINEDDIHTAVFGRAVLFGSDYKECFFHGLEFSSQLNDNEGTYVEHLTIFIMLNDERIVQKIEFTERVAYNSIIKIPCRNEIKVKYRDEVEVIVMFNKSGKYSTNEAVEKGCFQRSEFGDVADVYKYYVRDVYKFYGELFEFILCFVLKTK